MSRSDGLQPPRPGTLLMLIGVLAVNLGAWRLDPWFGVQVTIPSVVGIARAYRAAALGWDRAAKDRARTFLLNFGGVALIECLAAGAFFGGCFAALGLGGRSLPLAPVLACGAAAGAAVVVAGTIVALRVGRGMREGREPLAGG